VVDRLVGDLRSSPIVTRYPANPILSRVPYAEGLVYNGAIIKFENRYVMLVRVDHANLAEQKLTGKSSVALAFSKDGIRWEVEPKPCLDWADDEVIAVTDPRMMLVEGRPIVSIAVQTRHGMQTFLLSTEDFSRFELISWMVPDNRDVVVFPQKFRADSSKPSASLPSIARRAGNIEPAVYLRTERPFSVFGHGKKPAYDIWISESPDFVYWGRARVLLGVEQVPYANDRVGAGTAPIRTQRGWLMIFHAVDSDPDRGKNGWEEKWTQRYSAGVMLLDVDNPRRVLGFSKTPLLTPEAPYEVSGGYRNNIVFPCGAVLEDDGEVKIYYGAADTVQCLASAHIDDLIALAMRGI
jgi:beta-1,4-mannooligosaccharide/beta-1,4-mannosyl-N-acetylglucosamine phosphorylase